MESASIGVMLSNLLPLVIIGLVIYFIFFRGNKEYKKLPTLVEYLKENPDCKTNHGIKCNKCNSNSIKNWGISNENDVRRFHICNHCNTKLYKS